MLSLIIILVSGLFVGMVLGLQGYETLQTYGSEDALGVLVALVAGDVNWGRWWRRCCLPAVPGRDHGRNRPDEGNRAIVGDGDDGG